MNDFSRTTAPIRTTTIPHGGVILDARDTDDKVQDLEARVTTLEQRQDALESKRRALWIKVRRALLMVAEHVRDEWGL